MSLSSINKATYTSIDGLNSYINTSLQSAEVSIFIKYKEFYAGKNILDIGCGAGRTSFHLRNFTDNYTGVDYSDKMIQFCEKTFPELRFLHCDARDLSQFEDKQFDFVLFSYNGIDYISNTDRLLVFKEIKRVLKDTGLFVFSTHNRNFKDIITTPNFQFSLNPVNFSRNIINYFKERANNKCNKKEQILNDDYAILNDSGNHFSLLTYYISKEKQISQLDNTGFSVTEMFDMNGQALETEADDNEHAWIYFVSRKK